MDFLVNILGEAMWHNITSDESIVQVSNDHMKEVVKYAKSYLQNYKSRSVHFLEVSSYAHITGYLLAKRYGWNVTLSDISIQTLVLGTRIAKLKGIDTDQVRKVAIDFHELPFPDGCFEIVYIASALHHTLSWQIVLKELQRVTAPGGLLILQNEPCRRNFCFYMFPTNRPNAYRPIEAELNRQGILNTIAEPYPGSRPESLFGMIENQRMPLTEILQFLCSEGTVEKLSIDSSACMSKFDISILFRHYARSFLLLLSGLCLSMIKTICPLAMQKPPCFLMPMFRPKVYYSKGTFNSIKYGILERLNKVRRLVTATDIEMGYCFPTSIEVSEMAHSIACCLEALPRIGSPQYKIALADLFGGSITAVMRKYADAIQAKQPDSLRYVNGEHKGIIISYPPALAKILNQVHDLVPDIQTAETTEISHCFPTTEWILDSNSKLRFLVLTTQTGNIRLLQPAYEDSSYVVLLRIYGSPTNTPFRIQLLVNQKEIACVNVYQPDSFLLRGEIPSGKNTILSLHVCHLNNSSLQAVPPVNISAIRVVCIDSA